MICLALVCRQQIIHHFLINPLRPIFLQKVTLPAYQYSAYNNCYEISSSDDILRVPESGTVKISISIVNKHLACSSDIGHLAWQVTQEIYKNEELVDRTFNGTSRGLLISPRRRHSAINLIDAQVTGSTRRDEYKPWHVISNNVTFWQA